MNLGNKIFAEVIVDKNIKQFTRSDSKMLRVPQFPERVLRSSEACDLNLIKEKQRHSKLIFLRRCSRRKITAS